MKRERKIVTSLGYVFLLALLISFSAPQPSREADDPPDNSKKEAETAASAKGKNCFELFKADAEGHSPENAYLLALACHYNYQDKLDITPFEDFKQFQEKYQELFSAWGIDTFAFVQSSGRTFDTELVVMSPSDGDYVIVVFRGSERIGGPVSALKDSLLTDADCRMLDASEKLGEGVQVHEGFWNAFTPARESLIEAIEQQGGFSPEKKLWITGNSLGAALADLCAASLEKEGHHVHAVYTFGAPMSGNEAFRKLYEEELGINCQRYVNDNDIVPLLPPKRLFSEFRHVGTPNIIKEDGSLELDGKDYEGIGSPLKHYQEFYAYRLYYLLPEETQKQMPPPPPLPGLIKPFVE